MNLKDAIRIFDIACDPRNSDKHNRQDYVAMEEAMQFLVNLDKGIDAELAKRAEESKPKNPDESK